ncbi:hypothetical protein GCM10027514_14770 [Azotobacter armeniacus]
MPASPRARLVSAGRFKAIDGLRRRARFDASLAAEWRQKLSDDAFEPEAEDRRPPGQ